jgi:hypothetical protein
MVLTLPNHFRSGSILAASVGFLCIFSMSGFSLYKFKSFIFDLERKKEPPVFESLPGAVRIGLVEALDRPGLFLLARFLLALDVATGFDLF